MDFFGISEDYRFNQFKYIEMFDKVYSSGRLYDGPFTRELEEKVASFCGSKYAVVVGSGSDALFMATRAVSEGCGLFFKVPNYTFYATAESVLRAGCGVSWVDVNRHGQEKYMLDYSKMAKNKIGKKSDGVVYVPLFGLSGDIGRIAQYCRIARLILVEDCAQSLGTFWDGRHVGTFGKVGCFSFDPTKTFASPDGGGMVITDDEGLADEIRAMRYHGFSDGRVAYLGMNSRMSELGAAVLSYKIDFANTTLGMRRAVANRYMNLLRSVPQIKLPELPAQLVPSWSKFVIEVPREKREALITFLSNKKIPTKVHYPRVPAEMHKEGDVYYKLSGGHCHARELAEVSLSLPIHPYLVANDFEQVHRVCAAIMEFFSGESK